jgi:site-specific recombinase XerD
MKTGLPNLLGAVIRDYFTDHLPRLRGTSPHTIHSYRDSMVLLLRFLARERNKPITGLELTDLDPPGILAFLRYLEQERNNGVSTRNVRLSAIHAFFHFVASRNPEHLELAQRVLGIPFKRARQRAITTWNTRRLTRFSRRSTGAHRKEAVTTLCWPRCSTPVAVCRRSPICAPVISN